MLDPVADPIELPESVLLVPGAPTELPDVPDVSTLPEVPDVSVLGEVVEVSTLDEVPIVLEALAPLVVPTELLPEPEPDRLVPVEPDELGGGWIVVPELPDVPADAEPGAPEL